MKNLDLYVSYVPILSRIVDITDGDILELGGGFSTTLLDLMARHTNRRVVTYETDPKWFDEIKKWQSDYHDVYLTFRNAWGDIDIESKNWSVAFIDNAPMRERHRLARRLANNATYVLIHDSEPEQNKFTAYSRIYKDFKYRFDYTKCRPHTTVLSNFVDLSFLK